MGSSGLQLGAIALLIVGTFLAVVAVSKYKEMFFVVVLMDIISEQ